MEAFAAASGAGSMQQKLAATMALKHLISMDYPFCRTICMQEKGGPIDTDFTISIGGESQDIIVNNRKFTQQMYWQDDLLVLRRIAADSSFELLYTRQLIKSNGEQHSTEQYLMKSLHRDLATAKETEALSWFNKVGPSPLVVPSAASSSSITLPAPAISTPTSLSIIPKVEAEDIDDDHDEDEDDDVVLQRMKTRLTERESQLTSTDSPTTSSPLLNLSARIVSSPRKEFSSSTDHLSSLEAFKGVWTKSSGGNNTLGVPNASLGVEGTCNSVQYIDVTGHDVRIVDGSIFGELTEQLEMKLDTDFVASKVKLPTQQAIDIRTRCYLEDKTLVVHRINDSEKYEIYQRRTLESNGKIMRLVNTVVYPSAAEDRVPVESSFMFIKSI